MQNIKVKKLYLKYQRAILAGSLPKNKLKLVQAWIEIHKEELLANWTLAVNGEQVFKISPLK